MASPDSQILAPIIVYIVPRSTPHSGVFQHTILAMPSSHVLYLVNSFQVSLWIPACISLTKFLPHPPRFSEHHVPPGRDLTNYKL